MMQIRLDKCHNSEGLKTKSHFKILWQKVLSDTAKAMGIDEDHKTFASTP